MNMLEEKYENTVKAMSNDYEAKITRMQALFAEKEKTILETHKSEIEQLTSKSKMDQERIKAKYHDDLCAITNEYETKLTNLNLMIDSQRNEIDRLKKSNKDLELERNTIKQNLKSMLELQMKETMQLLGINNSNTSNNLEAPTREDSQKSSSIFESKTSLNSTTQSYPTISAVFNSLPSQKVNQTREESLDGFYESIKAKINSTLSDHTMKKDSVNSPKIDTSNNSISTMLINSNLKSKPLIERSSSASFADLINSFNNTNLTASIANKTITSISQKPPITVDEPKIAKPEIKDSFILGQIDLINKYYQIDNKTIAAAVAVSSSTVENNNSSSSVNPNLSTPTAPNIKSKNGSLDHSNQNSSTKPISIRASLNSKNDPLLKTKNIIKTPQPEQNVVGSNNSRSHDLRHFIEILLNKSPSASDNENEQASSEKNVAQMTLTPSFDQNYEPSTPVSRNNKM
jgi:hypothetical protein